MEAGFISEKTSLLWPEVLGGSWPWAPQPSRTILWVGVSLALVCMIVVLVEQTGGSLRNVCVEGDMQRRGTA